MKRAVLSSSCALAPTAFQSSSTQQQQLYNQRRAASFSWVAGESMATMLGTTFGITTPFAGMMVLGATMRFATMYFTMYGERALASYACVLPQLHSAYREYTKIAESDNVLKLEHDMALKKLKRDRDRIIGKAGGSLDRFGYVSAVSPFILGLFFSGPGYATGANMCKEVGQSTVESPFVLTLAENVALDMAMPVIVGLGALNFYISKNVMMGFADKTDERVQQLFRTGLLRAAVGGSLGFALTSAVSSGLICAPAVGTFGAATFAVYKAFLPYCLGASLTTFVVKHPLVRAEPFKMLFDIPELPRTHGTYGNAPTGHRQELQKAYEEVRGEMTPEKYEVVMEEMERECDRRIRKWMDKYFGLFGKEEDYWSAKDENARRLEVIANQKMHNYTTKKYGIETTVDTATAGDGNLPPPEPTPSEDNPPPR